MDVLIAEDDPQIRTMLEVALRRSGLVAYGAPDGQVALECLASRRVGVLLLDLMMPRVSGFEVISRLAQDESLRPGMVLVFTAGRVNASDLHPQVVCGWISKPFDVIEVIELVKDLCEGLRGSSRREGTRRPQRDA